MTTKTARIKHEKPNMEEAATPQAIRVEGKDLTTILAIADKGKALVEQAKALQAKMKENHNEFWAKLAELYPQTKEGNWEFDGEYVPTGVAFIKPCDKGLGSIDGILEALGAKRAG